MLKPEIILVLHHAFMIIIVYVNCVINGTNQKVRNVTEPLRNLYTKVKCKLLRLPRIESLTIIMLADRISKQAFEYAQKINKSKIEGKKYTRKD